MTSDGDYAPRLLGTQLCGKWRLVRVLGSGGMATVFEGLHRNGKRVAVKVLRPDLAANPRLRNRFQREAYAANQVAHPDAVSVTDDDVSDDGLVFLVMDLLDGETLGGCLRRRAPLDAPRVVAIASRVLDVLAAAHAKGVIHRDIKPDNIFLTRDGKVKLLDFGIASLRELPSGSSELTGAGMPIGTPAFMAPEQALARADEVDATTDVWGLGATMFTALTGRFVHEGINASELLIAAATRPAPSLGTLVPDLPDRLATIVDRALAYERADRWPDAGSMRAALDGLGLVPAEAVSSPGSLLSVSSEQTVTQMDSMVPTRDAAELGAPPHGALAPGRRRRERAMGYAVAMAAALVAGAVWLMSPMRKSLPSPSWTRPPQGSPAVAEVPLPAPSALLARSVQPPPPPAPAPTPVAALKRKPPPAPPASAAPSAAAPAASDPLDRR